jgi:hypothetical protein
MRHGSNHVLNCADTRSRLLLPSIGYAVKRDTQCIKLLVGPGFVNRKIAKHPQTGKYSAVKKAFQLTNASCYGETSVYNAHTVHAYFNQTKLL